LGDEEYKKYFAENERTYRVNKKEAIGVEEYRKQQAEYMKEYMKRILKVIMIGKLMVLRIITVKLIIYLKE